MGMICSQVNPNFLVSLAGGAHPWAFGALAELVDNAVDAVRSGATFVDLRKQDDPRNKVRVVLAFKEVRIYEVILCAGFRLVLYSLGRWYSVLL